MYNIYIERTGVSMECHQQLTIYDNEVFLRSVSIEEKFLDKNLLDNNIKILAQFCEENKVFAMAAIQLGINKRILYLKNTDLEMANEMQQDIVSKETENYNLKKVLINPQIIESYGETYYWENCASCLDYSGYVKRPYKIKVKYLDVNQREVEEEFIGFEATVLSHELDHLDGILHIDIAEKILELPIEKRKKLRQKEGYKVVSKTKNYVKPNILKRRLKCLND